MAISILAKPALAARLAQTGRRRVQAHYDLGRIVTRYSDLPRWEGREDGSS